MDIQFCFFAQCSLHGYVFVDFKFIICIPVNLLELKEVDVYFFLIIWKLDAYLNTFTWMLVLQQIFDNIINRDIQWPKIPDEMSFEAYDLINK